MRWDALFDDLEAQAEAADREELEAEVRDRTRREEGLLHTVDRLRTAQGKVLHVTVDGGEGADGHLRSVGPDWLLLSERSGARDVLVSLAAVTTVRGLGPRASAPGSAGRVADRLDLRWALRGLARDRASVIVQLRGGDVLAGTLDRVGADHVDLAEHSPDEPRRAAAVHSVRLVPLRALSLLRSAQA